MSGFAVGDRVRIAAPSHPWSGSKGVITEPFSATATGLDWCIRLERDDAMDGHAAAARESDLEHLGAVTS